VCAGYRAAYLYGNKAGFLAIADGPLCANRAAPVAQIPDRIAIGRIFGMSRRRIAIGPIRFLAAESHSRNAGPDRRHATCSEARIQY
jgi:hypothetical protein